MSEQIRTGIDGIIVPEDTPEALAREIRRLLDDPALGDSFVRWLEQEDTCHTAEIEKLYAVIES